MTVSAATRIASPVLRLGHSVSNLRPSLTNGPGWRVAIWAQGCSLRCTQTCLNPHLLESSGGYLYSVDEVVRAIETVASRSSPQLEGISMLGGEPTDQAAGVAALFSAVHSLGLSTMLYTGLTFRALRARNFDELLSHTDILVDGPYIPELYADDLIWRGSSNQQVRCLGDRYDETALEEAGRKQGKSISIRLGPDGRISMSGLQSLDGVSKLIPE